MSIGGTDIGGMGVGEQKVEALPGVRLSLGLWGKYIQIAWTPAYIEDNRVGHQQAYMLVKAFEQPMYVQVLDGKGSVRAESSMCDPIFTRQGGTLIIGDAAKPKLKVLEAGEPDKFWRLAFTGEDGSSISASFGLWGSDAAFIWGRTVFKEGQIFGFKRSLIFTRHSVAVQPPSAKGDFLYGNSMITGPF